MRRLLCVLLFCLSQAQGQEVGANFNHDPELIDLQLLKRVPVEWVRTTPYIFEYINGDKSPETGEGLANVIRAKQAGYRVAFGFRWDFKKFNLPIPQPGSTDEKKYFDVAERILERVGGNIDIFKLGNEPSLETLDADLRTNSEGVVPLVRFTERLLTEVVLPCYRKHKNWKKPAIYTGSLPALFDPATQRLPGVLGLIDLAQNNPSIRGLSIHLHMENEQQMDEAFRFVRSRLPDKPIIVPEFSLHRLYLKYLRSTLGDSSAGQQFAAKYKRNPQMPLYEWYSLANQHQVSSQEWSDMFASRTWFPPHAMRTYQKYFRQYGVVLATYGFVSQYAPAVVPPNGQCWFINPIFPNKSLPLNADGSYPVNPLWFDDFVGIVNDGKSRRR